MSLFLYRFFWPALLLLKSEITGVQSLGAPTFMSETVLNEKDSKWVDLKKVATAYRVGYYIKNI